MESWHSVVLRRRADLAMEWCEEVNTQPDGGLTAASGKTMKY